MDEIDCPERVGFLASPYHRSIVNNAMRSGRYMTISEFIRESIEENGLRRGFVDQQTPQRGIPCLKA